MAKRRKIFKAEKEHVDYMSIGHTYGENKVWILKGGKINWWKQEHGMHIDVVGPSHVKYWRGRYEVHTHKATAIPPNGTKYASVPSWLIDKLEEEFGGDIKLYGFNPKRR